MGKGSTAALENTWLAFALVGIAAAAGVLFGYISETDALWWGGLVLAGLAGMILQVAVIATGVRIGMATRP